MRSSILIEKIFYYPINKTELKERLSRSGEIGKHATFRA